MMRVVHLTAHLGGGVGKALATLVQAQANAGIPVQHVFVCLEQPEKSLFLEKIRRSGGVVHVCPTRTELDDLVAQADIVQLEWWNHPATFDALCNLSLQPMRLLSWCHVSGLGNPIIPIGLVEVSHSFVFTSPCSYGARGLAERVDLHHKLSFITGAAGQDLMPERKSPLRPVGQPLRAGYLGSLNFSKLHPDYVDFLSAVNLPDFRVRMIGDTLNKEILEAQCRAAGRPGLLEFVGYTTDVVEELNKLDVLVYILNPRHYGAAENALVEAMAMGVVPVVLDNPVERSIVEHGVTGLVISSRDALVDALDWLERNPVECRAMGERASRAVREKYSSAAIADSFNQQYRTLANVPKVSIAFTEVFGATPADWFLSCQADKTFYLPDGTLITPPNEPLPHTHFERSKGTVFHFYKKFPDDPRLKVWVRALEELR